MARVLHGQKEEALKRAAEKRQKVLEEKERLRLEREERDR